MSFLARIFGARSDRAAYGPAYQAIVAAGRDPYWYRDGHVPDTVDGRFDMIAAVMALVLLRLEKEGKAAADASVLLTELFIADMEGSLREMGIGDPVIGKHVGKVMSALGGRLAAFRDAESGSGSFAPAVRRNVFHDSPPGEALVALVAARLERFRDALAAAPTDSLLAGEVPRP
ncbi:MAG TPA: ubiquinol-cytochrome C chaperone family protein [Sphingomicrobium sp.]|nr:ubiquinol-cytochrome C chaperone family protein [Sphingomicrobium sp.]